MPLIGCVEKDGGARGLVEGVCCVLLWPLTNGDEPAWLDLLAAGVEKKVAVLGFAWVVGGGDGSSINDLHSESRCLLMSVSLTGLSQMGQRTIWTAVRGMRLVNGFRVGRYNIQVCRHQTRTRATRLEVRHAKQIAGTLLLLSPINKQVDCTSCNNAM